MATHIYISNNMCRQTFGSWEGWGSLLFPSSASGQWVEKCPSDGTLRWLNTNLLRKLCDMCDGIYRTIPPPTGNKIEPQSKLTRLGFGGSPESIGPRMGLTLPLLILNLSVTSIFFNIIIHIFYKGQSVTECECVCECDIWFVIFR